MAPPVLVYGHAYTPLLPLQGSSALSKAIGTGSPPELDTVAVGGNSLTPAGLTSLSDWLSKCRSLKHLDLACEVFNTIATRDSAAACSRSIHNSVLSNAAQTIHVQSTTTSNGTVSHTTPSTASSKAQTIDPQSVRQFAKPAVGMLNWDAPHIIALEQVVSQLETLTLGSCSIREAAVTELARLLTSNGHLQSVALHFVPCEGEGGVATDSLLSALARRSSGESVTSLQLSGLAPMGFNVCSEALTDFSALSVLDLDCISMTAGTATSAEASKPLSERFAHIWKVLSVANGMTTLRLRSSEAYKVHFTNFAQAFCSTQGLRQLELSNVDVSASLKSIGTGQQHPLHQLESLKLERCGLVDGDVIGLLLASMHELEVRSSEVF